MAPSYCNPNLAGVQQLICTSCGLVIGLEWPHTPLAAHDLAANWWCKRCRSSHPIRRLLHPLAPTPQAVPTTPTPDAPPTEEPTPAQLGSAPPSSEDTPEQEMFAPPAPARRRRRPKSTPEEVERKKAQEEHARVVWAAMEELPQDP